MAAVPWHTKTFLLLLVWVTVASVCCAQIQYIPLIRCPNKTTHYFYYGQGLRSEFDGFCFGKSQQSPNLGDFKSTCLQAFISDPAVKIDESAHFGLVGNSCYPSHTVNCSASVVYICTSASLGNTTLPRISRCLSPTAARPWTETSTAFFAAAGAAGAFLLASVVLLLLLCVQRKCSAKASSNSCTVTAGKSRARGRCSLPLPPVEPPPPEGDYELPPNRIPGEYDECGYANVQGNWL